jgi:hypothetical protein
MALDLVISSGWLDGVNSSLAKVQSAGQAAAAVDAAASFADDVAAEVRGGGVLDWLFGSELFGDPWRSAAEKQVTDALNDVKGFAGAYSVDSTLPVGSDWQGHRSKLFNLYALAQTIAKGYPADTATDGIASVLLGATSSLATAIMTAPAVLAAAPEKLVGAVVSTGKAVVKGAGEILKEATSAVSDAATSLIPWPVVIGAVLIGAGAIFGVVYMAKAGVKVPLT